MRQGLAVFLLPLPFAFLLLSRPVLSYPVMFGCIFFPFIAFLFVFRLQFRLFPLRFRRIPLFGFLQDLLPTIYLRHVYLVITVGFVADCLMDDKK